MGDIPHDKNVGIYYGDSIPSELNKTSDIDIKSTSPKPREWYLNPIVGYKCEVNENGIGLTGNEVHVIEHSAYQAALARAERAEHYLELKSKQADIYLDECSRLREKTLKLVGALKVLCYCDDPGICSACVARAEFKEGE
jgi:hypothetical protein